MRRKFLGWFGRQIRALPVVRPQDRAKRGSGLISVIGKKVIGSDTRFTTEVEPGWSLMAASADLPLRITEIISDNEALLDEECEMQISNLPYKVLKKVDQSKLFDAVWKCLEADGCIGIFPEGGSHDRPELLPLKVGIAVMSLGFVNKYQRDSVVVPCGFTYFEGHRFRSQVVIEFGSPIVVTPDDELMHLYRTDRKKAYREFLSTTKQALEAVTLTTSSYAELSAFHLARRLYQLLRQLSHVFKSNQTSPEFSLLKNRLLDYHKKLQAYGLKQEQVKHFATSYFHAVPLILFRLISILLMLVLAFPGLLINAPAAYACQILSAREMRQAKANSNVKIEGKDVVASYKLIVSFAILPILYIFYTGISFVLVALYSDWTYKWIWPFVVLVGLPFFSFMTVKVNERCIRYLKSLPPLIMILSPFSKKRREELLRMQEGLTDDVMKLIKLARNSNVHYSRPPSRISNNQIAPLPQSPTISTEPEVIIRR